MSEVVETLTEVGWVVAVEMVEAVGLVEEEAPLAHRTRPATSYTSVPIASHPSWLVPFLDTPPGTASLRHEAASSFCGSLGAVCPFH